jgi:Holliday junction DNA helicase RuvA
VIAGISGVLTAKAGETIVVQTEGGVGYALTVPLGVFERLPAVGHRVTLHTELVVREDGWALYGFDQPTERSVFQRLLLASGFGPRLALALLSTLGAERTVRAIQQRDLALLSTVSGIGKKKAERLVLELQDRFEDLAVAAAAGPASPAEAAAAALVRLGYSPTQSEDAVREATAAGAGETASIIRQALARLTSGRGSSR